MGAWCRERKARTFWRKNQSGLLMRYGQLWQKAIYSALPQIFRQVTLMAEAKG